MLVQRACVFRGRSLGPVSYDTRDAMCGGSGGRERSTIVPSVGRRPVHLCVWEIPGALAIAIGVVMGAYKRV